MHKDPKSFGAFPVVLINFCNLEIIVFINFTVVLTYT